MKGKKLIVHTINYVSNLTRTRNVNYFSVVTTYKCSSNDLINIASSNNIIKFQYKGETLYFKECRRHAKPVEYVIAFIREYFDRVCQYKEADKIKNFIINDLKEKKNFKKFFRLCQYCTENYKVITQYDGWDVSILGMPTLYELYISRNSGICEFMSNYFPQFIEYARNEIDAYRKNFYISNNSFQIYRASLAIATWKLSGLLGIEDIIAPIWCAKLIIDDNVEKYGTVTAEAKGRCSLEVDISEKRKVSPEFQKKLITLNVFDALCFQRDHKQENYYVVYNGKMEAEGVCAFDNDAPMTFFPLPIVTFDTCVKCSPVVVKRKYNRPYIDRNFFEKIEGITFKKLYVNLKDDLSFLQLIALRMRIESIKRAIWSSMNEGKKLLKSEEWNKKTIECELSGKYGKTYLKHYVECDENKLIFDILNNK